MPKGDTAFQHACERYAEIGVNAAAAVEQLARTSLSVHCWQGDDVAGFEGISALGGGLAVTGAYPGKARSADELRADLDQAYALIPGRHRLNLHAFYAETDGARVDRDELEPRHFQRWIDWARAAGLGLDFNPTYFSHPKADDGFTLSHADEGIRQFWIDHGVACRRIASAMGQGTGTPAVTNVWIPDGFKDLPVDRRGPRERLSASLDAVFAETLENQLDAVESKLFGIGSESYVVGSHEFYLGYAISRRKVLCLDAGHFHPTEGIADKLSAVFCWLDSVLLHVSRGVRWDSDHVVILSDDLQSIMDELVVGGYMHRTYIGLDYFDASINRVAAWVIGARATLKAMLRAMLQPIEELRAAEVAGDFTTRLALHEHAKSLPWGDVWRHFCEQENVPFGKKWLDVLNRYETGVLSKRV
jgi:L-rhamnose isomerase